jgi:D-alanyl-D-alanine carboxypeptidase
MARRSGRRSRTSSRDRSSFCAGVRGQCAAGCTRAPRRPPAAHAARQTRAQVRPISVNVGRAGAAAYYLCAALPGRSLADALERRGISVREPARVLHRMGTEEAGGDSSTVLAERQSPRLAELLPVVNKVSQNLHAELLLREVGRQGKTFGSREAGLEALAGFLEGEVGVAKEDVNFIDGSGMSRLTLLTPLPPLTSCRR